MKKWNFKVKSSQRVIIEKLESALKSAGGFVLDVVDDSAFNIRKRINYPDQILHRNRVVVSGELRKTNAPNETAVEISFSQHMYLKITVFSIFVFGVTVLALIAKMSSGLPMYIGCVIVLAVGILMWVALQKKLERDTEKYISFISNIIEPS